MSKLPVTPINPPSKPKIDSDAPPEDVKAQLNRILASPDFQASRQLSTFFRFVVEETLAGRAEEIKAYTIAVEAFKRESNFDPQLDPFIRVLAGRLRRALNHYYHSPEINDPVLIDIPKGTYVPLFRRRNEENISQSSSAVPSRRLNNERNANEKPVTFKPLRNRRYLLIITVLLAGALAAGWFFYNGIGPTPPAAVKPTIMVLPFTNLSGNSERDFFVHGMGEELSIRLSRFQDLSVISYFSSRGLQDRGGDIYMAIRQLGVDYAVVGSLREMGSMVKVSAQLIEIKSNQQLWGKTFEMEMTVANLFEIEEAMAENIVGEIGGGYGVISRTLSAASLIKRDTKLSVYEAMSIYRAYEYTNSAALYQKALLSLQQAVVTDPQNALAKAMLGDVYFDAHTLAIAEIDSAFEKGADCIRQAIQLDPQDPFARSMEGFMHHLSGEPEKALEALEISTSLNPNNGYLVGVNGWCMVFLGEFERGLAVMEKGIKLNPYYPGYFHTAYYLNYFRKGEYEKALSEIEKMNLPELFWDPLLRAAALAQLGKIPEARAAYEDIVRLRPDFPQRAPFYIRCYVIPANLVEKILKGLEIAGLKRAD